MNDPLPKRISVSCYSGYQYAECPVSFMEGDQFHHILEIINRWYDGGVESGRAVLTYFKVRTNEEAVFLLRYDPVLDEWCVIH